MWYNIFKFELRYRLKRPATYIYFGLLLIIGFLVMSTEVISVGGGAGQVKENAPASIMNIMAVLGLFLCFIASAVMGVPVLRDFEHKTESLLFTNPIRKIDYLLGRYLGSFLILILVSSGLLWGMVIGELIPIRDNPDLLPFNFSNYLYPFGVILMPNMLVMGTLFFCTGALSRKMLTVYLQGMVLLVIYLIANNLIGELDNQKLAALLDPFGINTIHMETRYWTITQKNTEFISLAGVFLYNRIIWVAVSLLSFGALVRFFSFNVIRKPLITRKRKQKKQTVSFKDITIPIANQRFDWRSQVQQVIRQSLFYFKSTIREYPFIGIVLCGLILLIMNSFHVAKMYGTTIHPTTYTMVGLMSSFILFFFILIVFYTGEMVWKERSNKLDQIYDAMPVSNFANLFSKFLGLILSFVVILLLLIVVGVIIQASYGYFNFELDIYFTTLFTQIFSYLVLFALLGFFIQVMVNNKFIGYAIQIAFYIFLGVMDLMGLEHSLWQFASTSLGQYSDMNTYAHFFTPFNWKTSYWFGFSVILFIGAILFAIRGTNTSFKTRFVLSRLNFTRPVFIVTLAFFTIFIGSGAFIFYNTTVLNEFQTEEEQELDAANYEKDLKHYEFIAQPRIVDVNLKVDLYPNERSYVAEGYYYLKNKTTHVISDIHIQRMPGKDYQLNYLIFDRSTRLDSTYQQHYYSIYHLDEALQPGDSIKMSFKTALNTVGFKDNSSPGRVLFNGTFFDNTVFPALGYNSSFELSEEKTRKEYDLAPKERMMARTDSIGTSMSLFGDDADRVNFEIVMSTVPDQIAIAPGYLQKEWLENGRRYFHYKMDQPMVNYYSMVSARYEVKRDKWNEVELEIYYHQGHEYNLDRMMEAMKQSLTYYSTNFSPYQYHQLRIMEFPRYRSFAQSFANTIPFSEGIGFIANVDEEEDVDYPFYVTAHEVGHQWWGHQVTEARVKGNGMLSEAITQYSSLMVMKHNYGEETMQKFLKYEMDRYLGGRAHERKKELPIVECENQGYIHYNKGSVLMYALQDYISEDSVNNALRAYLNDWAYREDRYPTTLDLMPYFEQVTPDSLKYLLTDMFETIILFENKTEKVTYELAGQDLYLVNIEADALKYQADSLGMETPAAINDWIDIGVYSEDESGKEKLIYLEKHKILEGQNSFKIFVNQKPLKAGIDPLNKLIDRNPDDNVKSAEEV